ncbi:MAG: hypothetical protein JWN78_780 [Bacteroidota bacterium]|nr:hypothetical protein [Bacteroidota bacterium]
MSEGGVHGTVADIRIMLHFLISVLASGVFLSHNHPSGNLQPSESDNLLTRKFYEALRFHEIDFIDHLIISADNFYSYRDNNLL